MGFSLPNLPRFVGWGLRARTCFIHTTHLLACFSILETPPPPPPRPPSSVVLYKTITMEP